MNQPPAVGRTASVTGRISSAQGVLNEWTIGISGGCSGSPCPAHLRPANDAVRRALQTAQMTSAPITATGVVVGTVPAGQQFDVGLPVISVTSVASPQAAPPSAPAPIPPFRMPTSPVPQGFATPETTVPLPGLIVLPSRRRGEAYGDCVTRLLMARYPQIAVLIGRAVAASVSAATLTTPIPPGPAFGVPLSVFLLASNIASITGASIGTVLGAMLNCLGEERPVM